MHFHNFIRILVFFLSLSLLSYLAEKKSEENASNHFHVLSLLHDSDPISTTVYFDRRERKSIREEFFQVNCWTHQ